MKVFGRMTIRTIIGAACGILVFGTAGPAAAQSESAVLEEVVVTAQKREESIQDVGISITAFSGEQLDTFGFTSSTDIAQLTPGVHLSGNNGGNTLQFTVRGVANPEFADLLETPNAVYVDEGYVATGQGQMFANFDMERVEILKGPQGTLFGRNATGGLIHYITRRPTDTFEAYGDVSYGSYDSVRFEGAVSGPIADKISGRISGFYNGHDGIWDNVFPDQLPGPQPFSAPVINGSEAGADGDIWTQDEFAVRGQLLFEFNDDMELLVKGQYAEQNPGSGPYQNIATVAFLDDSDGDGQVNDLVNTGFADQVGTTCEQVNINTGACIDSALDLDADGLRPGPNTDFFGYDDLDGEGDTTSTDHYQDDYDNVEIYGATANFKWDINDQTTFTSITNFAKQEKRQSLDVDSGPAPQFIVANESEHNWWTQEIRFNFDLDRADIVAGFYFLNIDANYIAGLTDTRGGFNVFGGSPSPFGAGDPTLNADAGLISDLETDSYSLFGQIDYQLTDQVTAIFGLRVIWEDKDFRYTNRLYPNLDDRTVDVNQAPVFIPPSGIIPGAGNTFEFFPPHQESTSDTLWSGKVGLNWTPTDDLLLYATVNRGVKAGSFNAPLLTFLTPSQYGYNEEVLVAYEGGFKSTLFGGKARFNGSIYYYDYSDYQIFQFIGTSGAVFNADANYIGLELDVAAQPFDNFDILFGFSWIDAEVEDVAVAPGLSRDVEPTFTPEFQTSGLARYTMPDLLLDGDVALQMDYNHASSSFYNINNFGTHEMEAYVVGNARVTWYHPNDQLEVQFFVNNLADEQYQNIGFELSTICGCDERSYGRPRWFGGRIRYSF